jgi:cytochrome c5
LIGYDPVKDFMSTPHNEHESAIKTPKQLIAAVFASFAVPILLIVLLVQFVTSDKLTGAGSQSQAPDAIASRIRPVADEGYTLKDANAPKVLQSGEAIYTSTCSACHGTGAAGAPKMGDNAGWAARIANGYEALLKSALAGKGAMPAKGGNADLDDMEIGRAIVHMVNASGGKFKEPEAKPAAKAGCPSGSCDAASSSASASAEASAPAAAAASASGK